jgi:hypothetical protein
MYNNNRLLIAISLSLASLIVIIIINIQIAKEYLSVDSKTRVLVGISEILEFGY